MSDAMLQISYSLGNIESAVDQFWQYVHHCHILAFSGEMGAGKTTFIHVLCKYLGVEDTISSPTFSLLNEYHFTDASGMERIIHHMDWYRLKDTEDAINAGMEDAINRKNTYSFIEWPEKAMELLPRDCMWVVINEESEHPNQRLLTVYKKND